MQSYSHRNGESTEPTEPGAYWVLFQITPERIDLSVLHMPMNLFIFEKTNTYKVLGVWGPIEEPKINIGGK